MALFSIIKEKQMIQFQMKKRKLAEIRKSILECSHNVKQYVNIIFSIFIHYSVLYDKIDCTSPIILIIEFAMDYRTSSVVKYRF